MVYHMKIEKIFLVELMKNGNLKKKNFIHILKIQKKIYYSI